MHVFTYLRYQRAHPVFVQILQHAFLKVLVYVWKFYLHNFKAINDTWLVSTMFSSIILSMNGPMAMQYLWLEPLWVNSGPSALSAQSTQLPISGQLSYSVFCVLFSALFRHFYNIRWPIIAETYFKRQI